MSIGQEFLILCRQNYFDKVTPAGIGRSQMYGYKRLTEIAKEYFKKGRYEEFAGFFQEGQYFINLWAPHLLLELGKPDRTLMNVALNTIVRYSDNPLSPDVAEEERTLAGCKRKHL